MGTRLIIAASPRRSGRCSRLAERLAASPDVTHSEAAQPVVGSLAAQPAAAQPATGGQGLRVVTVHLSEQRIAPCDACDRCRDEGRCVIDDDMQALYALLDEASDLRVVAPVYFAGPPAQYKALLDRLQAYYHSWAAGRAAGKQAAKHPLRLFVIGDGGDLHGFEPLVTCTRSAFAVAGFRLEEVYSGVGLDPAALDRLSTCPEEYRWTGGRATGGRITCHSVTGYTAPCHTAATAMPGEGPCGG
ncbi:MAG: flavodoxin family protein [Eggerthellaceae bacterium]|nr:flavodoxin family protein [Eggerthellaceae bacterium]